MSLLIAVLLAVKGLVAGKTSTEDLAGNMDRLISDLKINGDKIPKADLAKLNDAFDQLVIGMKGTTENPNRTAVVKKISIQKFCQKLKMDAHLLPPDKLITFLKSMLQIIERAPLNRRIVADSLDEQDGEEQAIFDSRVTAGFRQKNFTVPFPPSVNHYWYHAKGRHFITNEGTRYRRVVHAEVERLQLDMRFLGRLGVKLVAYPPDRRRRDLDNLLKAPLDALQHAGVYKDDNQIDDLHIIRGKPVADGRLEVTLSMIETAH